MAQRVFVPAPPFPAAYGRAAMFALGLGVFGGFASGLYALGVLAFGWPAQVFGPLVQAHGQVQILGFAGLLILGVGGLLLPGFWRAKFLHPEALSLGGMLVGLGLVAQLIGQPLGAGPVRTILLSIAALLPPLGFTWAGVHLARARPQTAGRLAPWEILMLVGAASLLAALLVRAIILVGLAASGLPASYGVLQQLLVTLELEGFLLAATIGVQVRLLPGLARTRPISGRAELIGIAVLILGIVVRGAGIGLVQPDLAVIGSWLIAIASAVLFWVLGLGRSGVPPTVQAPATLLPGRTRVVLRIAWAGLLASVFGRASGLLTNDAAIHAFTTVYLTPLIVVVGIRMLPRVSAYPVRFPRLSGALVWAGVVGGILRAFGGMVGGIPGEQAGAAAGAQTSWLGGLLLTAILLVFAALAWSPWGVPTGVPRTPEAIQAHRGTSPK